MCQHDSMKRHMERLKLVDILKNILLQRILNTLESKLFLDQPSSTNSPPFNTNPASTHTNTAGLFLTCPNFFLASGDKYTFVENSNCY